jgi:glycosyltransferase involved in cell wall biosynthesis
MSESVVHLGATILITTKNRKDDLRRALLSAIEQKGVCKEIIVMDDGSDDGTFEMVCNDFPTVRLYRSKETRGRLFQRNRAASLATHPILVTLDDDAAFSSPDILAETLREFNHPRIGAVLIPIVDLYRKGKLILDKIDDGNIYIKDAILAGSSAVRVDVYKKLGGYREIWQYAGEEEEFSARMLRLGYVVRFGRSKPIHHYVSPVRNVGEISYYTARNSILFVWAYVPLLIMPIHLMGTIMNNFLLSIKSGNVERTIRGLFSGLMAVLSLRIKRFPLSYRLYRLLRVMKKKGPLPLNEIEHLLPDLGT